MLKNKYVLPDDIDNNFNNLVLNNMKHNVIRGGQ